MTERHNSELNDGRLFKHAPPKAATHTLKRTLKTFEDVQAAELEEKLLETI